MARGLGFHHELHDRETVAAGVATQALRLYDLPASANLQLICRSENETYKVDAPGEGRWALRIQRPGYQLRNALASEMAWLVALRKDGVVATPIPVAGRNGEWVQTVNLGQGRHRDVVLFAWENGRQPTLEDDLRRYIMKLGAIAATMHAHGSQWARPSGFQRFTWDFETTLGAAPRWGRWRDGLGIKTRRIELFDRAAELIRRRLDAYGSEADRFGLVHGDLRLANLLVDQGALKVIDFDDCGFSWYMYDLAAVVSFYEHLPVVPELIGWLLQGYRTVRAVSQAEEEEIPTFLMLRRLLLIAWIGSHPEADLARSLGVAYTDQTVALCTAYLRRFE
jgi:Ser/Thr protein kinase RdoA (MazF antagonist)